MNSKGHLIISIIKSVVRITGGVLACITKDILPLAFSIVGAEILGILEELVDER